MDMDIKQKMFRKKTVIVFIIAALIIIVSACGTLLETERETVTRNIPPPYEPVESPPAERIVIADSYELSYEILNLIYSHEHVGLFVIYNHDVDGIQEMAESVVHTIKTNHPVGAYATSSITAITNRTEIYTEIDVVIEYKRTQEQLDSVINAATIRYLRTELLGVMRNHREEVAFRTSLRITEEEIRGFVETIYYENPRIIIMLPVVAFEAFPPDGDDRIIELRFGNIEPSSILQQYAESLDRSVRYNAGLAVGDNDAEILLALVRNLIASTQFDEAAALAISEHGPQNFAATAFGTLVRQHAVGEGFAMAFKALSDELGFDTRVVRGHRDGMVHAWNIVSLFGEFYHIDVAMGALHGIETAFLRTDDDFIEMLYVWDFDNTVRANGTLTYQAVIRGIDVRYNYTDTDDDDD